MVETWYHATEYHPHCRVPARGRWRRIEFLYLSRASTALMDSKWGPHTEVLWFNCLFTIPPTKLREGNVFTRVHRGGGRPCSPWRIGPHCTRTPLPQLVTSGGYHERLVHFGPPPLVMAIDASMVAASGNGKLSCLFYCQQMKLREGNVFTPVCQSFCSQEGTGSLSLVPCPHL